ncbi:Protein tyrosine kinase [Aspergillus sclerotialis]|uniref:Protein tyrosine kinase n=1 Tax=Aspergillus sclerotialis TaxID=2070753 RepID=A0A3A2ZI68_9EURO|nr:Protein tyrosine kinase [Aspergillus sclerotialis]
MDDQIPDTITICQRYCPPGVKRILATGTNTYIGEVDDSTVLKYPLIPGRDIDRLEVERQLLELANPHERIIALKGVSSDTGGLYLERARNGNIGNYLHNTESERPRPSDSQRLAWCHEVAEAVVWIHSRRVLHCDLHPWNVLLDDELHVKLADFQGRQLSEDGSSVLLDGWSAEPARFFCPRDDPFDADVYTEIFALGCTIYFIMMGHAVFPDIIDGEKGWREKVADRFEKGLFPQEKHVCSAVILKCWRREYGSAQEVVRDIISLENGAELDIYLVRSAVDHKAGFDW